MEIGKSGKASVHRLGMPMEDFDCFFFRFGLAFSLHIFLVVD